MKIPLPIFSRRAFPSPAMAGAIVLVLCVFGMLAEDIAERESIPFDVPLLNSLHALANPLIDDLMLVLSWLGSASILLPVAIVVFTVLWEHRRRWEAAYWAIATGGAALLNMVGKHIFQRDRPGLWPSLHPEFTFSFPSGHAMQSMAVCMAAWMLWRRAPLGRPLAFACCLFIAGVGLSRLYLGVHYPSDVIAGWCVSFAWCAGLALVMERRWVHRQTSGRAGANS